MKRDDLLNANGLMAIFLLVWTLYIFYPFKLPGDGISADGVTYAHIAKNIFLDGSPGWQATWTAPFFPALAALLYPLFGSFAIALSITSKIMTALLPLAVYLLARDVFNFRVGIFAAVLTAFHPHFMFSPGAVEPEPTYTTLQVFSLWAIWRAFNPPQSPLKLRGEAKGGYLWAIFAGMIASLAYQTRSEGLLIFLFMMTALSIISIFRLRQRPAAPTISSLIIVTVITTSFILTSLPYLSFLKNTYGKWVLSPKSSYVQIWMKWRIYHDNDLGEQGNPELWGLSNNGKLMWQEPKGIGDLAKYLMSHPQKSWQVYKNNFLMQIPGRIPNNSGQWLYPQVYPWYFVIPAICYILLSIRGREKLEKAVFLTSPFIILFILPIFTEGWWKYLLPYSPLLIVLAVAGLNEVCELFNWKSLLQMFTLVIVLYSIWAAKASPLVVHGDKGVTARISMAEEQAKAGKWAQKIFHGTPNYMITWSKLAYYLNGRWTAMPVTTYDRMIWYARKNKVDYIVFETGGKGESDEIIRVFGNTTDLERAGVYESPSTTYGVVFFKLNDLQSGVK